MNESKQFKSGVYLHYKGVLYEADHLMRDANDGDRIGVHYIGLSSQGAKDGPRHMIRTWEDWIAIVHRDGTICENNKEGRCLDAAQPITPRFRYLGPYYENWMLAEKAWPGLR